MMREQTALQNISGLKLPTLINSTGERAAWRFVEFFTVNIRNKNTCAAYGQAAGTFLHWCAGRGNTHVENIQSVHVAGYIEQLQMTRHQPVKQHTDAGEVLFDWLVTG